MHKKPFLFTVIFVFMAMGLFANENPEAVSPGHELRVTIVDGVCPTFSWAQVPGAAAYQIAVFEMSQPFEGISYYEDQAALSQPVLIKNISGSASSWTPTLEQALQNGERYVWFVQAQDAYGTGPWSVGKKFAIRAPMGLTEIREKVKEQLEAKGIKSDLVDEAFEGLESEGIKSKEEGELRGKVQDKKEEGKRKEMTGEQEELRDKKNLTTGGTNDYTAGALGSEDDGNYNVYYGDWAGNSLTGTAYYNSFFGCWAGYSTDSGDSNTFMGRAAGYYNTSGDHNVFLGYRAGYYETGSDRLYIENSNSSSPLIYGEFDNDLVTINGTLNVTDSNINVDTTSTRARFKLQADGGGTNTDDYFNFTMRNDYGDVTLSVWDNSASSWLPMLSYEYLNNKVDFKDNDIVTTGTISSGGGAYTSGGAWIEASSRDYKENIMELDQAESIQALEQLNPVRYNYKNKKDEEFLGFIAEDVPDLVAMNGRKGMRAMDVVAVLTKVVQNQQNRIDKQEEINIKQKELIIGQNETNRKLFERINELKERIKELKKDSQQTL